MTWEKGFFSARGKDAGQTHVWFIRFALSRPIGSIPARWQKGVDRGRRSSSNARPPGCHRDRRRRGKPGADTQWGFSLAFIRADSLASWVAICGRVLRAWAMRSISLAAISHVKGNSSSAAGARIAGSRVTPRRGLPGTAASPFSAWAGRLGAARGGAFVRASVGWSVGASAIRS